jgi:hypothetical protein
METIPNVLYGNHPKIVLICQRECLCAVPAEPSREILYIALIRTSYRAVKISHSGVPISGWALRHRSAD